MFRFFKFFADIVKVVVAVVHAVVNAMTGGTSSSNPHTSSASPSRPAPAQVAAQKAALENQRQQELFHKDVDHQTTAQSPLADKLGPTLLHQVVLPINGFSGLFARGLPLTEAQKQQELYKPAGANLQYIVEPHVIRIQQVIENMPGILYGVMSLLGSPLAAFTYILAEEVVLTVETVVEVMNNQPQQSKSISLSGSYVGGGKYGPLVKKPTFPTGDDIEDIDDLSDDGTGRAYIHRKQTLLKAAALERFAQRENTLLATASAFLLVDPVNDANRTLWNNASFNERKQALETAHQRRIYEIAQIQAQGGPLSPDQQHLLNSVTPDELDQVKNLLDNSLKGQARRLAVQLLHIPFYYNEHLNPLSSADQQKAIDILGASILPEFKNLDGLNDEQIRNVIAQLRYRDQTLSMLEGVDREYGATPNVATTVYIFATPKDLQQFASDPYVLNQLDAFMTALTNRPSGASQLTSNTGFVDWSKLTPLQKWQIIQTMKVNEDWTGPIFAPDPKNNPLLGAAMSSMPASAVVIVGLFDRLMKDGFVSAPSEPIGGKDLSTASEQLLGSFDSLKGDNILGQDEIDTLTNLSEENPQAFKRFATIISRLGGVNSNSGKDFLRMLDNDPETILTLAQSDGSLSDLVFNNLGAFGNANKGSVSNIPVFDLEGAYYGQTKNTSGLDTYNEMVNTGKEDPTIGVYVPNPYFKPNSGLDQFTEFDNYIKETNTFLDNKNFNQVSDPTTSEFYARLMKYGFKDKTYLEEADKDIEAADPYHAKVVWLVSDKQMADYLNKLFAQQGKDDLIEAKSTAS